jgi:N-acyl-L-homoserine lactone synthetase
MPDTNYDIFLCDTPDSKKINYRIRYQVYCLEKKYENACHYPADMEADGFDEQSVHFIAWERSSRTWIAACRLIIAPPEQLPLFRVCPIKNMDFYMDLEHTAEISRLCALYSRRSGLPIIIERLLMILYGYSQENHIEHVFSLHSLSMNRVVKALGFSPQPISSECQHRGRRRVYHTVVPSGQGIEFRSKKNGSMKEKEQLPYRLYSEYVNTIKKEEL